MLTSQYAYHTHQGLAYLFGSATERGGVRGQKNTHFTGECGS